MLLPCFLLAVSFFWPEHHLVGVREAELLVDWLAERRGVQGDDVDATGAALFYGELEQLVGKAASPGLGGGVEVKQIGARGLGIHPVWREVLKEDAGAGQDVAVFFEEQADIAVVGEAFADPGFKGGVHLGEAGFAGEVVVLKHAVTVRCNEGGVAYGGAA